MSSTFSLRRLAALFLSAGLVSCNNDSLVLPEEGAPAAIAIVGGDAQTGASSAPLGEQLVVLVTDELDRPVAGEQVVFTPVGANDGDVTPDTVVTDLSGEAATHWVLGPGAGSQQVQAGVVVDGTISDDLVVLFAATATAGNAARLTFVVQPSSAVAGVAMGPAVKVEVQDQNGNRVANATTPVTLSLTTNPAGATLGGGGPVNAVNGVATFSNISLNRSGNGYTLTASAPAGFTAATSVPFNVSAGAPDRLDWTLPSAVVAGATITPAQVTVRDALGNIVLSPSVSVTVAIQDNSAGGTLSGTKTVGTVNGVATFANLSIDRTGSNYSLRATGGGMTRESSSFNVLAGGSNRLSFRVQPANSVVGATLSAVEVSILDASGNLATGATNSITIVTSSSETGALSGTSTVTASGGIARFTNLQITRAGNDYQFRASSSALADALSETFDVAKAGTTAGITARSPTVSVVGQSVSVSYDVNVTAPGSGSLTGSVTVSDGTTSCIGEVTASGTGSCSLTFNSVGTRSLTTSYSGDLNFNGSSGSAVSHAVNKASTTLNITSDSPDPSRVGQPVLVKWSFSVASPGGGSPTGAVQVVMAGDPATCTAPVAVGECELTPTTAGDSRTLTATYAGDANYNGDSDTELHVVQVATTTTTIGEITPSPSLPQEQVTVPFSVTTGSGLTPTGTVSVRVNGTERCTATLPAGSCAIPGATFGAGGTFTISAVYSGDAKHASSSDSEQHTVTAVNSAPVANDDVASVGEDGSLVVNAAAGVLQNDTDAESSSLTAELVAGPTQAAAFTLNADGSFSYTPAANFYGTDSFTYRADDGEAQSNVATVTITVTAVNDAPSFTAGVSQTVTTDDVGLQSVDGWATAISPGPNEGDQAAQLEFEIVNVSNPELFTAEGGAPAVSPAGTLTYTIAGIAGDATISLRLNDHGGTVNGGVETSGTQTFTITVTEAAAP